MSTNVIFHTKTQYEFMNLDKKSGQKEPVTSIAKKMFTGHWFFNQLILLQILFLRSGECRHAQTVDFDKGWAIQIASKFTKLL